MSGCRHGKYQAQRTGESAKEQRRTAANCRTRDESRDSLSIISGMFPRGGKLPPERCRTRVCDRQTIALVFSDLKRLTSAIGRSRVAETNVRSDSVKMNLKATTVFYRSTGEVV